MGGKKRKKKRKKQYFFSLVPLSLFPSCFKLSEWRWVNAELALAPAEGKELEGRR